MLILWNVYNFFVTYANLDGWKPDRHSGPYKRTIHSVVSQAKMTNVLDEWILNLLEQLKAAVTRSLDAYDTVGAIDSIQDFVNDFSTWYIRRSRDRVGPSAENNDDKQSFYQTTHHVLTTICKLFASIAPFFSEAMYLNLTDGQSVHLADFPKNSEFTINNSELIEEMVLVRKIVEVALSQRKEAQKKVRQPLALLEVSLDKSLAEDLLQLIKDEVNVQKIIAKKGEFAVALDTETMTPELKALGEARDIMRLIQDERKKLGTSLDEKIDVTLESWPEEHEGYIKRNALVNKLSKGSFEIKRLV